MINIMFDIPSDDRIEKVVITEPTIKSKDEPEIHRVPEGEERALLKPKKTKKSKGMETA